MELLTLDEDYQPSELVENYESLIWTERYFTNGDFRLVTTDIERMLNLMQLESVVTLRDSTVPMVVEVHSLSKKKNSLATLTITGRSYETVLDRRAVYKTSGGVLANWVEAREKESDAAYQVMRQILGDIARPPLAAVSPINSEADRLPMLDLVMPADYTTSTLNSYQITPGNLYSVVRDLLNTNYHGLKAVRPVLGQNQVALEIYNGADLRDDVAFDVRFDQFDESAYLLSYAGSANTATVVSSGAVQQVNKNAGPEPLGLDRRAIYLDISSESGMNSAEARRTRGLIELYQHNVTALYDGKLADYVATGYNQEYFLGDIVKLIGEYGLSETARVTEFIRSDDNTGSKAYPTFEAVPDA